MSFEEKTPCCLNRNHLYMSECTPVLMKIPSWRRPFDYLDVPLERKRLGVYAHLRESRLSNDDNDRYTNKRVSVLAIVSLVVLAPGNANLV